MAYFKVNEIERKAHREGGLYQFSQTEEYIGKIYCCTIIILKNYDKNKISYNSY